jgi:hypothetical protein
MKKQAKTKALPRREGTEGSVEEGKDERKEEEKGNK